MDAYNNKYLTSDFRFFGTPKLFYYHKDKQKMLTSVSVGIVLCISKYLLRVSMYSLFSCRIDRDRTGFVKMQWSFNFNVSYYKFVARVVVRVDDGAVIRQGRSVVFPSRYAQEAEGKRAPKVRGARGVWGHAPPENFYF